MRVRLRYIVTLAMGEEVCSFTANLWEPCEDTLPFISLCNFIMEASPLSRGTTRRDV